MQLGSLYQEVRVAEDWQSRCGIQKIVQDDPYGCGIACLAMVTGVTYDHARQQFNEYGLGVRRGSRPGYSTSSGEMRMALGRSGLLVDNRRWKGWAAFQGLGILKVKDDWRGAVGRWHWVVAFRHPLYEIALFDPHQIDPSFKTMPQDVLSFGFDTYEPRGEWLQVEQRGISLSVD